MYVNTFKTILIVQLTFLNYNYWKKYLLNFSTYHQTTVHAPPVARVQPFEKHCVWCTYIVRTSNMSETFQTSPPLPKKNTISVEHNLYSQGENTSCVRLKFYYFSRLSHDVTGWVPLRFKHLLHSQRFLKVLLGSFTAFMTHNNWSLFLSKSISMQASICDKVGQIQ